MSSAFKGQTWIAAQGPWFADQLEDGTTQFLRRIVFCDTAKMVPAGTYGYRQSACVKKKRSKNYCVVFEVDTSWSRCTACKYNKGVSVVSQTSNRDVEDVPPFRRLRVIK